MAQEAREYQSRTIQRVRVLTGQGARRILVVVPTGGGKTTIAAHIIDSAVSRGRRVVFIAHRKELIDQCSARLDGEGVPHGIQMADHPRWRPWCPVQVVSIQTLMARVKKGHPPADIVFVDEAHRARADSYLKALALWPQALVLGLTATPWRADNKELGDLFDQLVVGATVRELTDLGFLVPVSGFAYDCPDLSGVQTVGSDYNEGQLTEVMTRASILGNVVGKWRELARGARTVVFACTIKHSLALLEQFTAAGVVAEHLDGTTPKDQREGTLKRLDTGETTVVCNVGILTEGWDCPRVECIVLARPTKSKALYLQMAGRGMRPVCRACGRATRWTLATCEHCGSVDLKRAARIHDHAGAAIMHGLPDMPREYGLKVSRTRAKQDSPEPVRQCQECYALYSPRNEKCPVCGFVNPKVERRIDEVEGDVVDFDDMGRKFRTVAGFGEQVDEYKRLVAVAHSRGLPVSWAIRKFERAFGRKPPVRYIPQFKQGEQ